MACAASIEAGDVIFTISKLLLSLDVLNNYEQVALKDDKVIPEALASWASHHFYKYLKFGLLATRIAKRPELQASVWKEVRRRLDL